MPADTINLGEVQTLRVVTSSPEAVELESTWATGGKPPPTHWHPRQHEHFIVLEGELTAQLGDEPAQVFRAGDIFDVPPRTAHLMWNAGSEPARASWRITPALRTEEMFRSVEHGSSHTRAPEDALDLPPRVPARENAPVLTPSDGRSRTCPTRRATHHPLGSLMHGES